MLTAFPLCLVHLWVLTATANNKRGSSIRRNGKRSAQRRNNAQDKVHTVPRIAMGQQMVFGFPDRILTKVRYHDTYSLAITLGSLARQIMYLNSTFDPDNTGTGHQPLYRDTYASIYDQYAVVACKYKVKVINTDTDTPIICGAVIDDDNVSTASVNVLCEQNHGQYTILPPLAGSLSSHTFIGNWTAQSILGIDPYTSQTYKTAVGSNPSEISSLIVWATNFDASTMTVTVSIELEQTVLWTELTTPTAS